ANLQLAPKVRANLRPPDNIKLTSRCDGHELHPKPIDGDNLVASLQSHRHESIESRISLEPIEVEIRCRKRSSFSIHHALCHCGNRQRLALPKHFLGSVKQCGKSIDDTNFNTFKGIDN